MHYRVTWEIDIEAGTPEQAAKMALLIQRDPESTATNFSVSLHGPCPKCKQHVVHKPKCKMFLPTVGGRLVAYSHQIVVRPVDKGAA